MQRMMPSFDHGSGQQHREQHGSDEAEDAGGDRRRRRLKVRTSPASAISQRPVGVAMVSRKAMGVSLGHR
jgi:hypothetical protein